MELIEARTTDPEIGGYAAVAKSVAQDAQLFVAKLLAFSRTSSTLKEPVDVHAVIADAVEVARRAPGHGVLIKLELNAQCSTLIGEAAELRNVFVNLLLNAFHAVDSARGVIVIRTRNCSGFGPGESAIEVDVEDNGSGIPRTIIERVFDPFVTSRTTRVGAGLGLVVARATIEDHRGSISVAKTSETGTIMRLLLPLECPCTPADVADSKAVTLPRPEPHPEGHQILLCDDDDRVRETLAAMMEALGHHVTQAECGMECIELFAEHPEEFDMVIVDQIMPDMLGDEVILHLYDLDPNAKIAWLSGYRAGADEEFIQPAVAARLSKPITLAELSNAIERVVATD
jgi:CheY-like chemotaxis protein